MKTINLIFSLLILFIGEPSFAMTVAANKVSLKQQINNQNSESICKDKDGNIFCPK